MLNYDLDIRVNDTFHSPWWAVRIDTAYVDLSSGWTVRAQVRDSDAATTPLMSLGVQLGTGTVTLDGTSVTVSTVRVHIPATATQAVGSFTGRWDLEVEHPTFDNGSLFRHTVVGGIARASRDVSR